MDLPLSIVAESFNPPAPRRLDFDSVGSPRTLRPRPVGAGASAEADLRADLAWFWNSNADWADDQIAVGESYPELVRRLAASLGLREGDRIVLCGSEPDGRRAAWRAALPDGVEVSDWRPRRLGRVLLRDLEALLHERTRLVLLTKACPVTGSLNEIIPVARLLEGTDAMLVTEASHFVAHGSLDIRNLRCDAVITDVAELFGARGAALWARRLGPGASANGTVSSNVLAGLARAVSYAERLGEAQAHARQQVAVAAAGARHPLAGEAEETPTLRLSGDAQRERAPLERRDLRLAAERGVGDGHVDLDVQIVAAALEARMAGDADAQEEVARSAAAAPRTTLAADAHPPAVLDAGRNVDLDAARLAAGLTQLDGARGSLVGLLEAHPHGALDFIRARAA